MSLQLYDRVSLASEKVEKLLDEYKKLFRQNKSLEEENILLKYELNSLRKVKGKLEQEMTESALVNSVSKGNSEGSSEVEAKLSSMIEEIDACISLIDG